MNAKIYRKATLWMSIITLLYYMGCILSPEEEAAPPVVDPITFEDLTEKEHVIINLVNSYRAKDETEYLKLLLSDEYEKPGEYGGGLYASAYFWYNQEGEALNDPEIEEFIDLQADYSRTNNIFAAAEGTPNDPDKHQIIDKLSLKIFDGTWTTVDTLFSNECEDCWKTERIYEIELEIPTEEDVLKIHGYDLVQFYIVPVQDGDKKTYRIAMAKDILNN